MKDLWIDQDGELLPHAAGDSRWEHVWDVIVRSKLLPAEVLEALQDYRAKQDEPRTETLLPGQLELFGPIEE